MTLREYIAQLSQHDLDSEVLVQNECYMVIQEPAGKLRTIKNYEDE
jgi:hypothetical protein